MITPLPNHSRSVGDTTPGVPLAGKRAREGKRATLLLDYSRPCTKGGAPRALAANHSAREFRNDAEVDG